ncbi:MAG TPA: carboxypeptidase-like regulatory domain-containing protein, partial [Bacteroidia bacterium]|nr:carboxypeptidase-like regulatory domain-containing protein [Bacteroidia bacterium]
MRRIAVIAFSFLLVFKISAQAPQLVLTTEISGKVIDASTKEPLPYVNIRLIGSLRGDMTNPKGEFYIKTIEKVDSISFSFVGYRTRTVPIKRGKSQHLSIEMGSEEMQIIEITVKAGKRHKRVIDTAAYYVYHQVVNSKSLNRSENVNSYKYDSYEKFQISLLNPKEKLINFFLFKPFKFVFKNTDTTEEG